MNHCKAQHTVCVIANVWTLSEIDIQYHTAGNVQGVIFSWFSWLEKTTNFSPTNVQTTCVCAQLAARAIKWTRMMRTRFCQLSRSFGTWSVLTCYFEKKKNVQLYMALFHYLINKDSLLDPNTYALKELAIPIAIAALYNASMFYPWSRDMYNGGNVCAQGAQPRLRVTMNFFPRTT